MISSNGSAGKWERKMDKRAVQGLEKGRVVLTLRIQLSLWLLCGMRCLQTNLFFSMRNKALKLGSRFRTGRLAFLSCCEQAWCDSLAIGDGTSEQNYEARCTMTPALSGLAFFISTPAVTSRAVSKLGLWHRLLNECRFSSAQRRLSADAFVVRLEVRLS